MDQNTKKVPQEVRVYPYRWVVLCLVSLVNFIIFVQFLEFSIIADVLKKYYGVSSFVFDMMAVIPFIIYLILFTPLSFLIEKYSLKVSLVCAIAVTVAGNVIKIFCNDPSRFYIVVIGQLLCGIGQIYSVTIPTKFASVWFGPEEVSTASAVQVLALQLGTAIGCVVPPFLVVDSKNKENIENGLFQLTLYNAIAAGIIMFLVCAFFKAKPQYPPSISQLQLFEDTEPKESYIQQCKMALKNRDFIILLFSMGNLNGIWNSLGVLVNPVYLEYFPDGATDCGIITLLAIISGGCIGSLGFGILLDKTHAFKRISIIIGICSAVAYVLMSITFISKMRIATFFTVPLVGLFMSSLLVVSFEYSLEVTYPVPEAISCSILNAFIYLASIIFVLVLDALFSAIGTIATFCIVLTIIVICTLSLFLMSRNLRRREANLTSDGHE